MRRSALLLACALTASVAAVVPATVANASTPTAHPPAAAHKVRSAGAFRTQMAKNAQALAKGAATPVAAPRVAHLDPTTANVAASHAGKVRVTVSGSASSVAAAAAHLGGRVLVHSGSTASVLIKKSSLAALAGAAGVIEVSAPNKAYADSTAFTNPPPGPSQAGAASGASVWNTGGFSGAGVKIAIVDAGFGDNQAQYNAEVTAGHLGTSPTVINEGCTDDSDISTPYDGSAHGLQTAELVHQQAPEAQLFLYCVGDSTGVAAALSNLESAGVKIVSCSLSFPGDARGDGNGAAGSTTAAVEQARKAGILWVNSAGNQALDHFGGPLVDANSDTLVDIGGATSDESDGFYVLPGADFPAGVDIFLQWDQWPPVTSSSVKLELFGYQCGDDACTPANATGLGGAATGNPTATISHTAGHPPIEHYSTSSSFPNYGGFEQIWFVYIVVSTKLNLPSVHYDLNYYGDIDFNSFLACSTASTTSCIPTAGASQRSISEPADSPYAFAVGAADVGADGVAQGTFEPFSSQGPTIDGRVKPDITGWDGLSSYLSDFSTGFYGTSAAAPTVAGAAADVLGSNPSLDAAQLQNFLEQHASSGAPHNPPSNSLGHGLLTLGSVPGVGGAQPPVGTQYTPITPVRVLDTRTTLGGHHAVLGAGGTATVHLSTVVPADATSVVINLTGTGATGSTYLAAYPGAFPGTSNLNLSTIDRTAAVLAPVTLSAGKTITIRNNTGSVNVVVDLLGYFGSGEEVGRYTPLATPTRVLDTRTTLGGHKAKLPANGTVQVNPALPPDATAAIVNVTAAGGTGGFLSAAPGCTAATSTVNFSNKARANLAIVQLNVLGGFCIKNGAFPVDAIVDVLGYFGTSGAQYISLPAPVRILDTRTGNGETSGYPKPIGSAARIVLYGTENDVPATAVGLFTDVVEANTTTGSYLTAYPGTASAPTTTSSTVNFSTGRVVSNAALVGLSANQFSLYNNAGSTNAATDLFGYFLPVPG